MTIQAQVKQITDDAYLQGLEIALEFIELSTNKQEAENRLRHMIYDLKQAKTNKEQNHA